MFMGWHFLSFIAIKTTLFQRCTVFCHLFRWKNIVLKATAVLKLITEKNISNDREVGSDEIFSSLEEIGSDNKSESENILGDPDIEFISEELLTDINYRDTEESDHEVLVPDAGVSNTPLSSDEPPPERKLKDDKLK